MTVYEAISLMIAFGALVD
ncbi:putative holin-like toxin [Effusibacillus lacus]